MNCLWEGCSFSNIVENEIYNHCIQTHGTKNLKHCLWRPSSHRPACKIIFNSKSHYRDHIITHFSLAVRPCVCEQCDLRFRNRQELWRHRKNCSSASAPQSPLSMKDSLSLLRNPVPVTQIGVRSSMALVLLLNLGLDSSVPIPINYLNIIQESIARSGYANARISPLFMKDLYNYMILVHSTDCHDSQSLVAWRREGRWGMMDQSQPVYLQIIKSCASALEAEINKLMVLSCQLRMNKTQPHPSFNPYRQILLGIIRDVWVNICVLCNEDTGQIIELSPSSPFYRSPEDCRCAVLGLRIAIQYQVEEIPLTLRKNSLDIHMKYLNEKLAPIIGAKFELVDRDAINQLCCQGFVCEDFCEEELGTPSSCTDSSTKTFFDPNDTPVEFAATPPAYSTRFKIVKASSDSAEMIFWFKIGRNVDSFVMSDEPTSSASSNINLVNAIDERGIDQ